MKLTETEINELEIWRCVVTDDSCHDAFELSPNRSLKCPNSPQMDDKYVALPEKEFDALLDTCQDLIREQKVLESLKEDSEDTQLAIVELAWALRIDAEERWDHDSCPNNADIIREIVEEAKALRSREKVLRDALSTRDGR